MARIFSRVLVVLLTVLLIVGGATSLPSCTPSPSPQVTLGKMHIIGATHLFIAPGSGNKLFKITEEGYVQEVTYEDESGSNVTMVEEPVAIYDVDSEYVIVVFSEHVGGDISKEGYLVRKSDGAVFSLENAGCPMPNSIREYQGQGTVAYFKNAEAVFTDSSGDIFYMAQSGEEAEIIKLNIQNMDSITKTVYSPSGDNVWIFVVDKDGNAAYWGCMKGDRSRSFKRIRTAEGSIHDGLLCDVCDEPLFWLGLDGVIYCMPCMSEFIEWNDPPELYEYLHCAIEKISINATTGVPTKSEYSAFNISSLLGAFIPECYKLELKDRVILVGGSKIFEVYNPTNSGRSLDSRDFDLIHIDSAAASDNFYYLHGSNNSSDSVLIKVDPTDDSYTFLLSTDEYYIYTMSTSASDELIFSALRMADGVNIVGKFDVSGNLTILDEESDVEMVVLERIQ